MSSNEIICQNCEASLQPEDRFCLECGQPVLEEADREPVEEAATEEEAPAPAPEEESPPVEPEEVPAEEGAAPSKPLEDKLQALEKKVGFLQTLLFLLGGGLALVLFVVVLSMSQAPSDVSSTGALRAESVELVNSSGRTVVYLGPTSDGNGLLRVNSSTGDRLVFAGSDVKGYGQIRAYSKEGETLVYVGASKRGNGYVEVNSKSGNKVASLP